jgi:hypothetical protein
MKALLFVGSIIALCGCATHQTLPDASISGRIVDSRSHTPIGGAKVAFSYSGPTRDLPASKGQSQFMPAIDAGAVLTDSDGRFSATLPARTVKRPLMDAWSSHPDIEVSKEGYETVVISELSILPRYHQPEGPPKFTKWPYTDNFEVKLVPKRPNQSVEPTRGSGL